MRLMQTIRDFRSIVREYKSFFVPKYCSTVTFYLGLIFMLILPRRLFTLPNKKGEVASGAFGKNPVESLTDKDKQLIRETFDEYFNDNGGKKLADKK